MQSSPPQLAERLALRTSGKKKNRSRETTEKTFYQKLDVKKKTGKIR